MIWEWQKIKSIVSLTRGTLYKKFFSSISKEALRFLIHRKKAVQLLSNSVAELP